MIELDDQVDGSVGRSEFVRCVVNELKPFQNEENLGAGCEYIRDSDKHHHARFPSLVRENKHVGTRQHHKRWTVEQL